jgi:hypothetical protein
MGICGDFRWHMRARASRGSSLDRMRIADVLGRPSEVVSPRWWDLPRWWAWLRADGYYEAVLHGPDGVARYYRMRTRTVPRPPAQPITLDGGKRIVPRPVTEEQLREYVRRRHPGALDEQLGVAGGEDEE